MILRNRTDEDVSVNYKGTTYKLYANEAQTFPDEVAAHWLTIHGFLTVEEDVKPTPEIIKEEAKKVTKKK